MQLTIKVRNAEIVKKGLQNLRLSIPKIAKENIDGAVRKIIREMQDYPPLPSGSRYVRTYRFKNSWRAVSTANGFKIENKAQNRGREYSRYVVGNAKGGGQAGVHVGRWLLFKDVVDYYVSQLPPKIESRISYIAKGI